MINQGIFFFEKLCNKINYFKFIEDYLKVNHILKKDFLNETGINAGTYRSFLKNMNRNSNYFYGIISKKINIYLPNNDRIKELNDEFTGYFYDLLYLKHDRLKEDLSQIEVFLHSRIQTLEEIPFLMLHTIISISIGRYSYQEEKIYLDEVVGKLNPYQDILSDEFDILFHILTFSKGILENGDAILLGNQLKEMSRSVEVINGFVLDQVSVAMYQRNDYLNAILYAYEACESFYKQTNYIRLIYTKSNLANYYLLASDYRRAYQTFNELSFLSDLLDDVSKEKVKSGLFNSLVLLKEYEEAYKVYNKENCNDLHRPSLDIAFLFTCYKLNKKDEFFRLYDSFMELWNSQRLYEPYYQIIDLIYTRFTGKLYKKQIERTLEIISGLNNKIAKKLFFTFCTEK